MPTTVWTDPRPSRSVLRGSRTTSTNQSSPLISFRSRPAFNRRRTHDSHVRGWYTTITRATSCSTHSLIHMNHVSECSRLVPRATLMTRSSTCLRRRVCDSPGAGTSWPNTVCGSYKYYSSCNAPSHSMSWLGSACARKARFTVPTTTMSAWHATLSHYLMLRRVMDDGEGVYAI